MRGSCLTRRRPRITRAARPWRTWRRWSRSHGTPWFCVCEILWRFLFTVSVLLLFFPCTEGTSCSFSRSDISSFLALLVSLLPNSIVYLFCLFPLSISSISCHTNVQFLALNFCVTLHHYVLHVSLHTHLRPHTQDCQCAPPRFQARVGLLALCDPRQGCLGYVTKSRCLKNAHAKINPAPVAEN
jgi:hypothetical protein